MTRDTWIFVIFGGYIVLFFSTVIGLGVYKVKRRRSRAPVEFKFLRGPGETLRRRIAKFDADFVFRVGGAAMIPALVLLVVSGIVLKLRPQTWTQLWVGAGITLASFVAALVPSLLWALRGLMRFRDDNLGYAGERYVGDCLEPLKRRGWFVFHDVPAEAHGKKFNLDHVAVGPGGVWAIETKTRRKGPARPGFEPHKVFFDGQQLIWPWGEDKFGPEQAVGNADWLRQWIAKKTGVETPVWPVLAFPGWYVVDKAGTRLRVVKPEWLTEDLPKARPILSDAQIDLIARQLDAVCRDVED